MISATILKDSTNWLGSRLTTLVLTYPRYIHSEFMTHRVLSKNSASSRAIPTKKVIEDIKKNRVYPIWTENQKGMQGKIIVDTERILKANDIWSFAMEDCIRHVEGLNRENIHKQNANRPLEAFQEMKVICTGTEWDNFFELRNHEDAQPEIHELAQKIMFAMGVSEPEYLEPRQWHIPFGDKITLFKEEDVLKVSVARCARISYNTFEGKLDYEKDLELYNNLVNRNPKHLSPTEHQARVPTMPELAYFNCTYAEELLRPGNYRYIKGKYVSNLNGWIQYRKLIENETH